MNKPQIFSVTSFLHFTVLSKTNPNYYNSWSRNFANFKGFKESKPESNSN